MSEFSNELDRWMRERCIGVRGLHRRSGYSAGYISELRRGNRYPSPEAAKDLDDALEAGGKLAEMAPILPRRKAVKTIAGIPAVLAAPPVASWALSLHQAAIDPVGVARGCGDDAGIAPESLKDANAAAIRASLASDYTYLADALPRMIAAAEFAALGARRDTQERTQALLSDIYAITAWTLIKADSPAGAWVAAQRAIQAAENAADVFRCAAATRCLAEVHMRAGAHAEATRTAFLAAAYLYGAKTKDKPVTLVLRGSALLSAAAASARRGDGREARTSLKAAAACADELGEDRADLATVFGPSNTAIHEVAVAIELGEARHAEMRISAVDLTRLPPYLAERRSRYLIDVARTYATLRKDDLAIGSLLEAEDAAPEELRHHRLTRQVVQDLLLREKRSSGLRDLAARCGVLE